MSVEQSLVDSQSFVYNDHWYPKLIILNGCEISDELILSVISKWFPRYIHRESINPSFYDDITSGIFTRDNLYELRRYKTSTFPFKETYYLIHDKIVVDISITGNFKMELLDSTSESLKFFGNKIKELSLVVGRYLVITG